VPVLVLGALAFLSVWQGWGGSGEDPSREFARDLDELKAAYEKAVPDPVALKTQLSKVATKLEGFPDQAPQARFGLGSGYVRLAELTAAPDEARGYWTLAHQHFALVTEKQFRDPADASRFSFRANKARAAVGLAPDTPSSEIDLLIRLMSTPPAGEDPGDAHRLIAELALRLTPPNFTQAKLELSRYVQSGLATPAASLARGRLRLGQLYVFTHEYDMARKVLSEIGDDAPTDVQGPARAELAKVLMAEGNWGEAATQLQRVRDVWPPLRLTAAYQLGVCKLRDRKPAEAVGLFEEAAKGDGPEACAAAIQLADLHLRSADPALHKRAVDLLAAKLKGVHGPAEYDPTLVPLNDAQATFELALSTLLADGAYPAALAAAEAYAAVASPGRDREKKAEVLGAWGAALKKESNADLARDKFSAAAEEYAALAAAPQLKTDGKLDLLRRSASSYRQAGDPATAASRLEEAVALDEIPEPVVPLVWVELADALLAANRFDDVWPILNKIMASKSKYSTATQYRLARQFVDSRYPGFVQLGRALFEQIANMETVASAEREFHERSLSELAHALIREGKYADADNRLRTQLRLYENGPEAGLAKLLRGVCLLQRAAAPSATPDDATRLRKEALGLFKENVAACDAAERRNGKLTDREAYLRVQSAVRVLQAHQQLKTAASARDLLYDAVPLLDRYRGTVEELIVLSLMYHAFRQAGETGKAAETRDRMKDVFDKLPPAAFTGKDGEYSREYWQTVWFAPEKK
jgi:tetratricopeptide (TPR) repeat protein